jgi:GxxExxY protein
MHGDSHSRYDSRGDSRGDYRGGGGRGGRGAPRERRGIPLSALDPALTAVSHKVIGCARDVHMALGSGFSEAVYAEALRNELTAQGVSFEMAYPIAIRYKEAVVGQVIADFLIEGKFILEVMAEPREVSGADRSALRAQLRASDMTLGLIINFAGRLLKDGLVRVLNVDKLNREGGLGLPDEEHEHESEGGGQVDFDENH